MTRTTLPPEQPLDTLERDAAALAGSLRRAHRTVLVVIASCAAVSAIQPAAAGEPVPDPTYTTIAVTLALGVIIARRAATSRVVSPGTRLVLTLSSYAFATGLAMLGTFVAMTLGQPQTGLVFALAAGIFCLRPPKPLPPSRLKP